MTRPRERLCAARRHAVNVASRPCGACEKERLRSALAESLVAAHPLLSSDDVGGCIDGITGSIRGLSSLARQLADHQDGSPGHRTQGFCQLLWALRAAGATDVELVICNGCGATPRSLARSGTDSLCSTCYADRHRRACGQCGAIAKVGGVDDDRRPLCRPCHTRFVTEHRSVCCTSCGVTAAPRRVLGLVLCHSCEATLRRDLSGVGCCSACGAHSHLVARDATTALCRSCATKYVSGEIARVEPAIATTRVEAILSAICTHRGMLGALAEHLLARPDALVALDPGMPALVLRLRAALCDAGATTVRRWECASCGDPARRRVGELCLPCHRRGRAERCAGCGELRPLARRGPRKEPWCARCAPQATVLFERCTRCGDDALPISRTEDGPRCGRCTRAAYEPPRTRCARCGRDAPSAANWPDGAVCYACYEGARIEWGFCASCGEWKITPGRDADHAKCCAKCSGISIDLLCPSCGAENGRFTSTQCSRCWVFSVLEPVLVDESGRVPAQLVALHEVLTDAMSPAVARHWIGGPSAEIVRRMARGEVPTTHDTLDALRLADGRDRHRTLRALLVTAGVLDERNEAIAGIEALVERDLVRLDATDSDKTCLRHYAHFELLRKLRQTQERHDVPGRQGRGTAAGKWTAAVTLVGWLNGQGSALTSATQSDLDRFLSTDHGHTLARRIDAFVNWGRPRGHVGMLRVPTERAEPRYDQLPEAELRRVAKELVDHDEWDLAPRVAGLLVILFGLTLPSVIALRCEDLAETALGTELSVRGFKTVLPAPVGDLAIQLARRSYRPGSPKERWLFPGRLAGQPISLSGATKQLAKIGFPTILARNAARRRLVGMLDPDVMRRVTDVSAQTANDLHAYYAQPSLDRMNLDADPRSSRPKGS